MGIIKRKKSILMNEPHKETIIDSFITFETDMVAPLEIITGNDIPAIRIIGKNLFDVASYPLTQSRVINATNGDSYNSSSYPYASMPYIPCSHLAGRTITLNKRPGNVGRSDTGFAFFSEPRMASFVSGIVETISDVGTPWTIPVPINANYMRFSVPKNATDIQLEVGSESTDFETYKTKVIAYNGELKSYRGVNNLWLPNNYSKLFTVKYWTHDFIIPPQYERVSYLRTTSHHAYFDSGVSGDDTTLRIEFDWMISKGTANSWGSYYGMMGQAAVSGKQRWVVWRPAASNDPDLKYLWVVPGTGQTKVIYPYSDQSTFSDKKMHFDIRYGTASINGITVTSSSTNPLNDNTIYFGTTSPTSSGIAYHYGYFWYIRMWSHGELIRNYLPVVRKSDNKAGFYDLINHTFNPSTGSADFIAGYDT